MSQQLVPTVDGGTAPAFEIMITNTAIRNLIREEKTHQLDSAIASGGAEGMRTMDQSLFDLVKSGRVAKEMALQYSIHQEALEKRFEQKACRAASRFGQQRQRPAACNELRGVFLLGRDAG